VGGCGGREAGLAAACCRGLRAGPVVAVARHRCLGCDTSWSVTSRQRRTGRPVRRRSQRLATCSASAATSRSACSPRPVLSGRAVRWSAAHWGFRGRGHRPELRFRRLTSSSFIDTPRPALVSFPPSCHRCGRAWAVGAPAHDRKRAGQIQAEVLKPIKRTGRLIARSVTKVRRPTARATATPVGGRVKTARQDRRPPKHAELGSASVRSSRARIGWADTLAPQGTGAQGKHRGRLAGDDRIHARRKWPAGRRHPAIWPPG
jgi:hypothetical protein